MFTKEQWPYVYDAALKSIHTGIHIGHIERGNSFPESNFHGYLHVGPLSKFVSDEVSKNILYELVDCNLIQAHRDEFADTFYEILPILDDLYEKRLADPATPLFKSNKFGGSWLTSALKKIFDDNKENNKSSDSGETQSDALTEEDNIWEPLPIQRAQPEFNVALKQCEEALETIQSDNGYAATEPEERNSIVWTIGAGVNALKEGLITKDQAQTLLLKPFEYLAKKFPDAIIGVSAKDAATAIWDWLKAVLSP